MPPPDDDVVLPLPEDDVEEPLLAFDDDVVPPPAVVAPLETLPPADAVLELVMAFTAFWAAVATLETTPRFGAVVDEPVAPLVPLPAAPANGSRAGPLSVECAGVDWTLSAGSVLAAGGGAGAGVCV